MQIDNLKRCLLDATKRYQAMSFDEISRIEDARRFEEQGKLDSDSYCQIEVEVLDRLVEGGIEVLHVPIVARDGKETLSAELFFYANGRVRWNGAVYQFKNGVPEILS